MKHSFAPLLALSALFAANAFSAQPNSYTQTNLVSDVPGMATSTDSRLVNPWGLSKPASAGATEDEWWTSDQHTGLSTLYDANATVAQLVVTIPPASGSGTGSPTGTVASGVNFLFVTLDGTVSEWLAATGNSGGTIQHAALPPERPCSSCHTTAAVLRVNHAALGAVYTGCTLASYNSQATLYVANASGGVEAYDPSFNPVSLPAGAFTDPNIPAGYTPYGIQAVGAKIYVTYSPAAPASGGYVDVYNTAGTLLLTLESGRWFDEPWGIAQAPASFGPFSGTLLVGNTGSGEITAFNPKTGRYVGKLENSTGQALAVPGLWALSFGSGGAESGPTTTLYFNAGIQNFTHGLFGAITAN